MDIWIHVVYRFQWTLENVNPNENMQRNMLQDITASWPVYDHKSIFFLHLFG